MVEQQSPVENSQRSEKQGSPEKLPLGAFSDEESEPTTRRLLGESFQPAPVSKPKKVVIPACKRIRIMNN